MSELTLAGGVAKYTTNQIIREVQREIEQRKRVYGRMVETGAMTQDQADYRIGIMEQIAAEYLAKAVE